MDVIDSTIDIARQFERMMKGKQRLDITGKIGEIKACFEFNLGLTNNSQSAGYDAVDSEGKKVQIKTRRIRSGLKSIESKRLSKFSTHKFDYCLLVLLNENYNIDEVWKAYPSDLEQIIHRHEKRNPTIREFKDTGKNIFVRKD